MPRTSTPELPVLGPEASACPSMIGIAALTPGTVANALRDLVVVGEIALDRLHDDVAVDPEDLVEELGAEAVHHRHHDDERRDAEHDSEEARSPAMTEMNASLRRGRR